MSIFLCESNEKLALCPCCDHTLSYRDSRLRICRLHGGEKSFIQIRRLRCTHCGRFHNELPDCLTPYKHYSTEVIEDVVDEVVGPDTTATEDYPCEATMHRWQAWIKRNVLYINGMLRSVGYRRLSFSEQLLKSGVSLLEKLQDAGFGWLASINRVIYNSGGFVPS